MREIVCEMCGSNDIVKQDGLFVCQSCGTKYSVEEARKLMTGEVVEVEGTVKIDTSSELDNLYEIARRAKDSNNNENALNYYNQILVKDPNSWEAQFYVVYFRSMSCKIGEIASAATNIHNCIVPVLNLVKDNITDEIEQKDVISEIVNRTINISEILYNAAKNHFFEINPRIQNKFVQQFVNQGFATTNSLYFLGDELIELYGETYRDFATDAWKHGVEMHKKFIYRLKDKESNEAIIDSYVEKIQISDSSYEKPHLNKSGCYVATCVYGSYNCSEVWTLRRFRDNTLDKNIFGRLFIKTYYATSPTIVKYFGNKKWFNKIFKPLLNKFVRKLQNKGVESTYYDGN